MRDKRKFIDVCLIVFVIREDVLVDPVSDFVARGPQPVIEEVQQPGVYIQNLPNVGLHAKR
jgi:hypothetical protein